MCAVNIADTNDGFVPVSFLVLVGNMQTMKPSLQELQLQVRQSSSSNGTLCVDWPPAADCAAHVALAYGWYMHLTSSVLASAGGIKLHHETSYLLASAAEAALQLSAVFYTAAWPLLGPVVLLLLAATSAVGGAVTALAVAADLLVVVVWPVEVVYVGGAALHRLQLRCARATWQLLRGKQKVGQGYNCISQKPDESSGC